MRKRHASQYANFGSLLAGKWLNQHTTPYIYSYYIRNHLVAQVPCKTYHASCSGMNIRHNTNLTRTEYINGQQLPDLVKSCIFYIVYNILTLYPSIVFI